VSGACSLKNVYLPVFVEFLQRTPGDPDVPVMVDRRGVASRTAALRAAGVGKVRERIVGIFLHRLRHVVIVDHLLVDEDLEFLGARIESRQPALGLERQPHRAVGRRQDLVDEVASSLSDLADH
jgi:hypothetical protein